MDTAAGTNTEVYMLTTAGRVRDRRKKTWFRRAIGGIFSRKRRHRDDNHILLERNGQSRVEFKGLEGYQFRYISDLYTTILEMKWRWALFAFFFSFFATFMFFAVAWWVMSHANGDFDNRDDPLWKACIPGLKTFADFFLFSVETQTSIGYGFVYPSTECGGVIPLLFLQVTIGFLLETVTLGFVFAKLARPKYRAKTLMLSENVCVCQENGQLCLQVRVADLRKTHLINARARGMLVMEYVTEEGTAYPLYQRKVDFEMMNSGSHIFLMWPSVLTHRITERSPFWNMRQDDLMSSDLELFVFLEGTIESTGELCQTVTSYVTEEIWWGYRFNQIEYFNNKTGGWYVDFGRFESIAPCPLMCQSAKELSTFLHSGEENTAATPKHGPPPITWKPIQLTNIVETHSTPAELTPTDGTADSQPH